MKENQLRELISRELLPMFPGSRLLDDTLSVTRQVDMASFVNHSTIALWLGGSTRFRLLMTRSQEFSHSDVVFASWFMSVLAAIGDLRDRDFFDQLLANAIPDAISAYVTCRDTSCRQFAFQIIRRLEEWSAQTYEGQPITCSIGIDLDLPALNSPTLDEIWEHDFGAVLSSGMDTILVANSQMQITSFEALGAPTMTGTAPFRLLQLAEWSGPRRILFCLNRNGEVLVFFESKLLFAKRHGRWCHFPHESMARRLGRIGSNSLRNAVYETCLNESVLRSERGG